ncbi:hypothetical protein [Haloferax sp. KTX1]|uniref:hypothetical protein n=1 Tax=Haloferax sp. KTX1 TaxID=2600597 RepID=UPI0011DD43C1|nr:hypothetical protein [Haloferax sp. KTX1]
MAESESATSSSDGRPALVRYVGVALRGWPPLFSVEDIGTGATVTYVGVRLDVISGEYYPFSALRKRLVEHDIVAEIVGLDTTRENDHPRLILEVSQEGTVIDEEQLRHREKGDRV